MQVGSQRGQGTVEWIGLVLGLSLVALALTAAVAGGVPGADIGRALAAKLVCAARLDGGCEHPDVLDAEYGAQIAELVRRNAPAVHFEAGSEYLPVDHRKCREPACARATGEGEAASSAAGLPATAFTRVIDCRAESAARSEAAGADCSGDRTGQIYVQYWLYYPDSRTRPWGEAGYHPDDWESVQLRIRAGRTDARASSHRSYSYRGGIRNWPSDAGIVRRSAWGPYTGELHVSAGSHAGRIRHDDPGARHVPGARLRLVPIEPIGARAGRAHDFEVAPPWLKDVYLDPEATGT